MEILRRGEIVGGFEIIEKIGSREIYGRPRGIYIVRCNRCKKNVVLTYYQIKERKDCGCSRLEKMYLNQYKRQDALAKNVVPWMDETEMFYAWKASNNPWQYLLICAQLNDVPVSVIQEIIKRKNEQEKIAISV